MSFTPFAVLLRTHFCIAVAYYCFIDDYSGNLCMNKFNLICVVKHLNYCSDILAFDQNRTSWTRIVFSFNLNAIWYAK